ncbi:galactokinase [Arthrobacter sp. ok909]|uniref:galactokinase n=1 Tax=Arthrobacter sp. ok909 TaxID=1761746 RepID=UPI0008917401|nr:galactokinase [Arthrobacter sp. ok909]SDP43294.1 galactokinase [Arthrobacter sp. ok909]
MTTTKTEADRQAITLTGAFTNYFGHEPDGLWRAPGRVNLMGEHTDYNEGLVLPFAIDRSTTVAVSARDDRTVRLVSSFGDAEAVEFNLDTFAPEDAHGWSAYPAGVAWELEQAGVPVPGFELYVSSDVPVGAGLSSSAALECAVALALSELSGARLERTQLADIGRRAENNVVGAPTGIMDQYASMLGTRNSAVYLDCRDGKSVPVSLGLEESGLVCLVIDTKVSHAHANGGYAARRASCARGAHQMGVGALRDLDSTDLPRAERTLDEETFRRVRHIITENERVAGTVDLLRTHGPHAIGDLLDASHRSMRDDFEISCPELNLAADTARANGALGARMTGGGFGGSAIALVSTDDAARVKDAVLTGFAARGLQTPDIFAVLPADGAQKL